MLGGQVLGEVVVNEWDFPWLAGAFEPGPAYADVAHLFAHELALIEAEDFDTWEEIQQQLRDAGLRMLRPDGTAVAMVLLHVKDDEAWFRWVDEAWDDDPSGQDVA